MDSPYDSNISEDIKELVERGFAIKHGRKHLGTEIGNMDESRAQVRDMNVFHVQRPLTLSVSAGAAAGRNTGTTEAGFKAVGEPRSITREGRRRSDKADSQMRKC